MLTRFKKIVFLIGAFGLIYSLGRSIFDYHDKLNFYKAYQDQYNQALQKRLKLKSEIAKAADYYVVERSIREKLNLLQPDEMTIILPQPTVNPTPMPEVKKPALKQWVELFW